MKSDENDKQKLPANHIFWEKTLRESIEDIWICAEFSADAYNTKHYNPHPFYKPISRVFMLQNVYSDED